MRTLPQNVVSLIHFVELNDVRWWDNVVDRLAIAMLWQINKPAPLQQLRKGILNDFDFDVKANELRRSINKLESKGDVLPVGDGRYKLSLLKLKELESLQVSSAILETKVKSNFCNKLNLLCPDINAQNIWDLFIAEFLIPLVTNEGARAYDLLTGGKKSIPSLSYIDVFLEKTSSVYRDMVRQVLYEFLAQDDKDIDNYLLTYLDAYFLISASGLPNKVLQELVAVTKDGLEFTIFVDTNFIYSILGLHDNPSNEAANDLRELVDTLADNVKIRFVLRQDTLDETQRSIRYHRIQLNSPAYSPNLAEAATSMDISGVYKTFFQRVHQAGKSINANDYFMPYENNLLQILEANGVMLFPETSFSPYRQTLEISEDINNQIRYETEKYGDRAKSEDKITHDVMLWHFIQDQRGKKPVSPFESKCWIVTVDYRFLTFDKYKSNACGLLLACMHPSQLLQLLRFFVPRSPQLEKTLLGVMRFPMISREFDTNAERISIRIVNHLGRHEGIEDISVPTLTTILADTVLRSRLSTPDITEEEERKAIESSLTQIVAQKDAQLANNQDQIMSLEKKIEELNRRVANSEERDMQNKDTINQLHDREDETDKKLRTVETNLQKTKYERDKYKTLIRIIISLFILIMGIGIIFILPSIINWIWLLKHQHKMGLQLSAIIFLIGILWLINDPNQQRRWAAIFPILAGVLIALTQII